MEAALHTDMRASKTQLVKIGRTAAAIVFFFCLKGETLSIFIGLSYTIERLRMDPKFRFRKCLINCNHTLGLSNFASPILDSSSTRSK
jgi:hypothetical protein